MAFINSIIINIFPINTVTTYFLALSYPVLSPLESGICGYDQESVVKMTLGSFWTNILEKCWLPLPLFWDTHSWNLPKIPEEANP